MSTSTPGEDQQEHPRPFGVAATGRFWRSRVLGSWATKKTTALSYSWTRKRTCLASDDGRLCSENFVRPFLVSVANFLPTTTQPMSTTLTSALCLHGLLPELRWRRVRLSTDGGGVWVTTAGVFLGWCLKCVGLTFVKGASKPRLLLSLPSVSDWVGGG